MDIAEIAPLLRTDKITPTISAEKNGKRRVAYPGGDLVKSVLGRQRPKPASLLPLPH
jgi:hypothetical protein